MTCVSVRCSIWRRESRSMFTEGRGEGSLTTPVNMCVGAVLQREKRESITVPRGEGRGLTHNAGKGIDKMVTVPQTYPG